MNLLPYLCYFKHQCVTIPEMGHVDTEGGRVFVVTGADEVFTRSITTLKPQSYQFRLLLPTSIKLHKDHVERQAGFVIMHYHSKIEEGDVDFIDAIIKADEMGWRIVRQMAIDMREGAFFTNAISKIEDMNVNQSDRISHEDPNYSGSIFTFNWFEPFSSCAIDTARLDGGTTPSNFQSLYANSFKQ